MQSEGGMGEGMRYKKAATLSVHYYVRISIINNLIIEYNEKYKDLKYTYIYIHINFYVSIGAA